MSQVVRKGVCRKKISFAVALTAVLLTFGACRTQNKVAHDPRDGFPQGVTYDDIEYYESFSMPRIYAGTTPPEHWHNAQPAGAAASHGASCPCCAGVTYQAYNGPNSPMTNPQQQAVIQQVVYTDQPQAVPQTPPNPAPQYRIPPTGQPQFLPATNGPQLMPPVPQQAPSGTNQSSTAPANMPNGKFSSIRRERQSRGHGDMLIRAQSPEEDLFGWGSDDEPSFDFGTEDADNNSDNGGSEDFETESAVTVPAQPTAQPTVTVPRQSQEEIAAEREALAKQEAALKALPTQDDGGIEITFDRRRKSPVNIDSNLKKQGENIVYNPQIYNEYKNPGGFQFRGIYGAWPQDEYLVDGGDDGVRAYVRHNLEIRGLEPEDTIAHYDTLDNRRLVETSNRVHIYSPRFGSVRKIDGAAAAVEWQHYAGVQNRNLAGWAQNRTKTGRVEQDNRADYARSQVILRSANAGANTGSVGVRVAPDAYQNRELAVAWAQLMTHKVFTGTELAYLAQGRNAAVAWGGIDHVEVRINELAARAMSGQKTPEAVFILGEPETSPKLKLFKVASKETAQRGEIVEFMIRFDNIGTELIGNVTIVDSLTTRLEYIEGSAGSSVPAEFFIEPNEAGSAVLRWEISEPLKAGDFGVVRFRCRVQ